jgi:hypothetical protein
MGLIWLVLFFCPTSRITYPGQLAVGVRKQPECQWVGIRWMRLFGLFFGRVII